MEVCSNLDSLQGVTVLTCRQEGRDRDLHHLVTSAGGRVLRLPLIEVTAPGDGGGALRDALARLTTYDWLVCTSANGVLATAHALAQLDLPFPPSLKIAAVGPSTAASFLDRFGRSPDLVPERSTARDLGEAFPPGTGRVIAPLAGLASNDLAHALESKGYDVSVVVAYETKSPPATIEQIADARSADVVVLASPSAVHRLVDRLGAPLPMAVVAIGPKSAGAATAVASTVIESADTSAGSVFRAIVHARA